MSITTTLTIQDLIDKAKMYVEQGLSQDHAIRKAIDESKLSECQWIDEQKQVQLIKLNYYFSKPD